MANLCDCFSWPPFSCFSLSLACTSLILEKYEMELVHYLRYLLVCDANELSSATVKFDLLQINNGPIFAIRVKYLTVFSCFNSCWTSESDITCKFRWSVVFINWDFDRTTRSSFVRGLNTFTFGEVSDRWQSLNNQSHCFILWQLAWAVTSRRGPFYERSHWLLLFRDGDLNNNFFQLWYPCEKRNS